MTLTLDQMALFICQTLVLNETEDTIDIASWRQKILAGTTVNILKIRSPEKFAVITLKFEQGGFR